VQDQGIAHYSPVFDRLNERFGNLKKTYADFDFKLDGGPVWHSRELYRIVLDLVKSLGSAAVIILVVLAISYRSLRIGLIAVVPNALPLAVTGAVLVAMGEPLFIASVCAFTVCLGIAVDDTIHFLSRYQQEQRLGGDVDDAIRRTFFSVGSPMIMTTIILVSGFASVLLSDLPAHRTFGAMACATIGTAVIGDLVMLPALLATFDRNGQRNDAL
jgi:predicted RND superfamily exporter protein